MINHVLTGATAGKVLVGFVSAIHFAQMMPYGKVAAVFMAAVIMFGLTVCDGLAAAVSLKAKATGTTIAGAGAVFMWICVVFLHGMSVYTSTLSFGRGTLQRTVDERWETAEAKILRNDVAILQHQMYELTKSGKSDSEAYRQARKDISEKQKQLSGATSDDNGTSATAAVHGSDKNIWLWSLLMAVMLEAIYLTLGIGTGLYRYILDDAGQSNAGDIMEDQPKPNTAPLPKNQNTRQSKPVQVAAMALIDPDTMTRKVSVPNVPAVKVPAVPVKTVPTNDDQVIEALQSLGFKGKAKAMAAGASGDTVKERIASALKSHGQELSVSSMSKPPVGKSATGKPASTADYQATLERVRTDIKAGILTKVSNDTLASYTNRSRSKSTKIINDLCTEGLLQRLENRRVIVVQEKLAA